MTTKHSSGVTMQKLGLNRAIGGRAEKSKKQLFLQHRCFIYLFACFALIDGNGSRPSTCADCLHYCKAIRASDMNTLKCRICLDTCANKTNEIFKFFSEHRCEEVNTVKYNVPRTTTPRISTQGNSNQCQAKQHQLNVVTTAFNKLMQQHSVCVRTLEEERNRASTCACSQKKTTATTYIEDMTLKEHGEIESTLANFTVNSSDMITPNQAPTFRMGQTGGPPIQSPTTVVCPTKYRKVSPTTANHRSNRVVTLWNYKQPKQIFFEGECIYDLPDPRLSLNRQAACQTVDNFHKARFVISKPLYQVKKSPFKSDICYPSKHFKDVYVCYGWVKIPSSCALFVN